MRALPPHNSRFTTLKGGSRIHYWDRGDPHAPPLVLLHGTHDPADTWELWAAWLERDFRVIAPDLPAHGLTGKTAPHDYGMDTLVSTLRELFAQLQLERVYLVGHSLGGNVAWRYALEHPGEVARLVLVASSGYPDDHHPAARRHDALAQVLSRDADPKRKLRATFTRAFENRALVTDTRLERWSAFARRAARARRSASAACSGGWARSRLRASPACTRPRSCCGASATRCSRSRTASASRASCPRGG